MSISSHLGAQEQTVYKRGFTVVENTLPPAPEAASIVKYADVPFNHSLGIAQYEVPIYTIQGRELSIPISLSYTTGGIKMDEVAGVAGLGWTLNAGGCITRTVVDMPDEFSSNRLTHQMPTGTLLSKLESQTQDNSTETYLRDVAWHKVDASLDRYSYNVCGLSGTFVYEGLGKLRILSGDGVGIRHERPSFDDTDRFILTGPDGTEYVFEALEHGTHDGSGGQPFTPTTGQPDRWSAVTAWHLTSIRSRSGLETATFEYDDGGSWNRNTSSHRKVFTQTGSALNASLSDDWTYIRRSYETKVLKRITLSGFTASFSYAQNTGNSSHHANSGVSVQNFPSRLTGISISAPGTTDLLSVDVGTGSAAGDGRIVLNSLRVYRGGALDDRYDFTYNILATAPSHLSQDWFGYYNGDDDTAYTRTGLCPYTIIPSLYTISLSYGIPNAQKASHMCLLSADHDGAKDEFSYEGALTGDSYAGNDICAGVRVKSITTKDGSNGTVKIRKFTYGTPYITGPTFPLAAMYMTTAASFASGGGTLPGNSYTWQVSLHDGPVGKGMSILDTRVYYGTVEETVSGPEPAAGDPASKTVRHYSGSGVLPVQTSTISRFPSNWAAVYNSSAAPTHISVWDGIRNGYADQGPQAPALLSDIEKYSSEDGVSFTRLSRTEYEYDTEDRTSVLTDYVASAAMVRPEAGNLLFNDIYHYPVYATAYPGRHPVSERHVEYHVNGGTNTSDEHTLTTAYVQRRDLGTPVRVASTSMTEGGVTRSLSYTYPDTWTGGDSWASSLTSAHALNVILRKDFRTSSSGQPAKSEITEYGSFTIGGESRLMPAVHRELTGGVEAWKEQVLSRDCLGNPTSVKETGRPETVILWSWNGLHPAAVIENATPDQAGSQNFIDGLAESQAPSSAHSSMLSQLRTNLASAHVSTFTWAPGTGLTSSTDPAGVTTSYEYDSHGRLAFIKDRDGNKVRGYSYSLLNDGSGTLNVRSRIYRNAAGSSYAEDVRWFDTLGRCLEDISIAGAGDGRDLVTARESDFMLHDDVKVWLPYPASSTGGSFQSGASATASSYHSSSLAYYSKTYEQSTRDRVLASAAPGYAGTHESSFTLGSQSTLPKYSWGSNGVTQSGSYAASALIRETTTDPDGIVSYTVRDHAGRILASANGSDSPTRYVYDSADRLKAVFGGGITPADTLDMWRYSYDSRGRVSSKGVPGSMRDSFAYYPDDTGSACGGLVRYRFRGSGRFEYVYDSFGRMTKEKYRPSASADVATLVEKVYDSYPSWTAEHIAAATGADTWSGPAKGMITGQKRTTLNASGSFTEAYATTVWLYDALERPVWIISKFNNSFLKEHITYDFSGNVSSDDVSFTHGSVTDRLTTATSYDVRGRMTSRTVSLKTGSTTLAGVTTQFAYDAIGRPSSRTCSVSGGVTLSSTDSYNLRQLMTSHVVKRGTSSLYTETLGYDGTAPYSDITPLHNGLISKRTDSWAFPNGNTHSRTVGYAYDLSGRLTREHAPSANATMSYDSRGNITGVNRGSAGSDTYSYSGDRLTGLARTGQSAVSFSHDDFGRMTADGLEGVAITYNCIDLPANVSSAGTTKANYYYLADGTATSVQKADKSGLVFRGPFTYRRNSAGSLTLESAACEEGRLTTSGAMLHVTDHLGSVVAVVRGSDGALYEASEYDACGKRSSLTNAGTVSLPSGVTQRDRFTGKQDQGPDFAVGYTDFGARHYSPSLRRWLVPDPLSEKYYGISPYAYCAGDPVNRVDPDGRIWDTAWDIANVVMDIKSLAASFSEGNVGRSIVDGVSTVVDIAAAAVPFIPGGAGAAVKAARGVDKVADGVKASNKAINSAKASTHLINSEVSHHAGLKIQIPDNNKVDRSILNPPTKRGNAPTFKSDGTRVEIHHIGQNPEGPFKEMHWSEHRGKDTYNINHPNTNSKINRKVYDKQRKEYWANEFKEID